MDSKSIKLTVVIPAYNEEKRIGRTLRDVDSYLEKQNYSYEILVVDNGSSDKTVDVVRQLSQTVVQNSRILEQKPLVKGNNKGAAVRRGIMEARGEYVVFMDADNATPISEIEKFWPYLEQGNEVVIGSRFLDENRPDQPFYKTVLSRGSNLLIQFLLIPHIKDTQAGFKAFKTEAAKKIFGQLTIYGWAFDMEMLVISLKLGFRIREVPITRVDLVGSHVPLKAYIESLRDLFIIKWRALTGKYSSR